MTLVKARKKFIVIAYDIVKDNKRNKIAKILEGVGVRSNYSVFECMITSGQLVSIQKKIEKLMDNKTDTVVYYTLCVDCFTKIIVQPNFKNKLYYLTNTV